MNFFGIFQPGITKEEEKCLLIKLLEIENCACSEAHRNLKSATQRSKIWLLTLVTKNHRLLLKSAKALYKRVVTKNQRGDSSPKQ
jgi:hypothetical protein